MKQLVCLLILSVFISEVRASNTFYEKLRGFSNDLLGRNITQRIFGTNADDEIKMPNLPKLQEDAKSVNFGNIDDPPKKIIETEQKKKLDHNFLVEIYREVRRTKPTEKQYTDWMNILAQGAKREGIYRALIYDRLYEAMERTESKLVSQKAIEFTSFYYDKFFAKKIKKEKIAKVNIYTLKRIVTEKSLHMLDALYQGKKTDVYAWYALISADMAIKYPEIWENKIRKYKSAAKHYRWAQIAGEQLIKSELIIKLNKLYQVLDYEEK